MKFVGVMHLLPKEFDSPDAPGSGELMDLKFVQALDSVRSLCGFPFIVDSGYRTPAHNTAVGGEKNSAHLEGKAADIRVTDSRSRYLIVLNAIKAGINRIGIAETFVHLDGSRLLDQNVIWMYPHGTKRI